MKDNLELAREAGLTVVLDGKIGREDYHSVSGSLAALVRFAIFHAAQARRQHSTPAQGEPVGYLPAYELDRLKAGHDANLRSAKYGPSTLDGDVAVYLAVASAPHAKYADQVAAALYQSADQTHAAEPKGLTEGPSFANPLAPYGMLVRALRIVAGTTLYDMAQALLTTPAKLSAMEFGRAPVTQEFAFDVSAYFDALGVPNTQQALEAALLAKGE